MGIIPIQSNSQNLLCKSPTFSTSPLALLHWISGMASKHVRASKMSACFSRLLLAAGPCHLWFPLLCGFSVIRPLFAFTPLTLPQQCLPSQTSLPFFRVRKKCPTNRFSQYESFLITLRKQSDLSTTYKSQKSLLVFAEKIMFQSSRSCVQCKEEKDKHFLFEAS